MQTAEKISVTLPPDMLRILRDAVAAGEYASTGEALRDAVRAWQRLEDAERRAALRDRARASLADPRPSLTEAEVEPHLRTQCAGAGSDARELLFRPAALRDLDDIFRVVLRLSGIAVVAQRYVRQYVSAVSGSRSRRLAVSTRDLGPGLRTVPFERALAIDTECCHRLRLDYQSFHRPGGTSRCQRNGGP